MATLLLLAGFFVFLACLAAFHSFLIATNQTTHELARCALLLPPLPALVPPPSPTATAQQAVVARPQS
jgi:hypothetical protein